MGDIYENFRSDLKLLSNSCSNFFTGWEMGRKTKPTTILAPMLVPTVNSGAFGYS